MRVQGVQGQLVLAIAFGKVAFLVPVSGAAHALLANTDGGWEYWLGICCRFLLAAPTAMLLFANSQAGLDLNQAIQPIVRAENAAPRAEARKQPEHARLRWFGG